MKTVVDRARTQYRKVVLTLVSMSSVKMLVLKLLRAGVIDLKLKAP